MADRPSFPNKTPVPVARDGAILHLGGACTDHDHVLQSPGPRDAAVRAALRATGAQGAGERRAQAAAPLYEQRPIDRFVRHTHRHVRRIGADQMRGDLLG